MMRRRILAAASVALSAATWLQPIDLYAGSCVPSSAAAEGFWHTAGNRIVDSQGSMVRIAAINWYGMEDHYAVPEGLQTQPLESVLARIRKLGFNTIRFAFSNQTIESNPVVRAHLQANPGLQNRHALDVLDAVVAAAGRHGLRIILDDHRSTTGENPEENGLWYTARYPEKSWIRDWQLLATRYRDNPTVVGMDLRNEPHTRPPGPWTLRTYLHQGATWGPWHGVSNPATDWRAAAERAGDAILRRNPQVLIIVEGIQQYPDATQAGGVDASWWGSVLQAAQRYPVRLTVAHRLVYSPHDYGPMKYRMSWARPTMRYQDLLSFWNRHWAFLDTGRAAGGKQAALPAAPLFLGEFGTCGNAIACVNSAVPGSQGFWFHGLMRYLANRPEVGWGFWALNGTNPHGQVMTNYVLNDDWATVRLPALLDAFHQLESSTCPPAR